MSDFWTVGDTNVKETSTGEASSGGGALIPHNTKLLSFVESMAWADSDFYKSRVVKVRFRVMKPHDYKNRVLFLTIKPFIDDTEKRAKELQKLAAILHNADVKVSGEPSDTDFMKANAKTMMVTAGVFKKPAGEDDIQYVQAIGPKGELASKPAASDETSTEQDPGF